MKKILFIVDREGWAYDDAAKNWRELLKKEYECDILYLSNYEPIKHNHKTLRYIKDLQSNKNYLNNRLNINKIFNHKDYDGLYFFYHRSVCDSRLLGTIIPPEKTAIAINNEKWTENPRDEYDTYLYDFRVIACCNSYIINNFKKFNNNIYRVSQSINEEVFFKKIKKTKEENFKVGWCGNWDNPYKKFNIAKKSVQLTGSLFFAEKDLTRKELNEWYNGLDLAICTSSSEGGPLMLLEAGACGVPFVTTRVGLTREIIKNKVNGFFIDKNSSDISKLINFIKKDKELLNHVSENLRNEILENWTYKKRLYEIKKVLMEITKNG